MNFLTQLTVEPRHLRPTATVVRTRDGKISVERADLLSKTEQQNALDVASTAKLAASNVKAQPTVKGELWCYVSSNNQWTSESISESTCESTSESKSTAPHKSAPPSSSLVDPTALHCLTFNVWFAEYEWERRQDCLLEIILSTNTDVVMLQEVTPRFLRRLLDNEHIQHTYRVTDCGSGSTFIGEYGNVTLVHKKLPIPTIYFVKFPGSMGRRGLVTQWNTVSMANIHLESLSNSLLRLAQGNALLEQLPSTSSIVIAGDFNITGDIGPYKNDHENNQFNAFLVQHTLTDAAKPLGLTFDTRKNLQTRRAYPQPEDFARYDRVLCRGVSNMSNFQLEGKEAFPGELWVSDHYGMSWDMDVVPNRSLPPHLKIQKVVRAAPLMSALLSSTDTNGVLTQLEAIFGALIASTITYEDLKASLPGGGTTFLSILPAIELICYDGKEAPRGCIVDLWTHTISQLILALQMYAPPSSDKKWPRSRFTPAMNPNWPEWYVKMIEEPHDEENK